MVNSSRLLIAGSAVLSLHLLSSIKTRHSIVNADLNPTEHLWDQLGRAVLTRVTNTTTLADLRQLLVEEWDAIPQQCVTKLTTSMRRRCQAVVAVHGSSACY
uniref:Uncharacterized protein n=1 Tax=Neolamprologus brichardi TaxID=32507 RepID=A0A3Q4H7B7_NEOBR